MPSSTNWSPCPPNTPFACAMGEGQCGMVWCGMWCGVAWRIWCVLRRVCLCCALVYKLESLPPNTPFACAMGEGQCGKTWRGMWYGVVWSGMFDVMCCGGLGCACSVSAPWGRVSVAWRGVLCCDVVWRGMFGVICCVE